MSLASNVELRNEW